VPAPGARLRLVAATAFAPAIWGTTYLTAREFFLPGRPLLAALFRALPSAFVLVALAGPPPAGAWRWRTVVLGIVNVAILPAFLFVAAYRVPGAVAATVVAIQPLIVVAMAAVFLRERQSPRALAATVVAFVGVALLVSGSRIILDGFGVAAAVVAATAMAGGIVLQKAWGPPPPLFRFTAWQVLFGGLALLPVTIAVEGLPGAIDTEAAAAYAFQAIVAAALGYALWFRGIGRLAPIEVAVLGLLSPLVAAVLGWIVLDESLDALQLAGAALVFGGLVAAQTHGSSGAADRVARHALREAPNARAGGFGRR
jgi:probable blue pigment (indigoidine) exporter